MRFVIFKGNEILPFNLGLLSLERSRALLEEGGNAFAEVFRAAGIALRDRGNLAETVSFTTSRKFATTDEADEWSATYSAVFPRTGYLDLYNESDEIIARLDNAIVQPPLRTVIGVSVQLSYTVIGGAMLVPDGEGDFETPEMMMGGEVVTME